MKVILSMILATLVFSNAFAANSTIPKQFIGIWTDNPKRSCGDEPDNSDVTIKVTETSVITPSMEESCELISTEKSNKQVLSGMFSCSSQAEVTGMKSTLTINAKGKLKVDKSGWLTRCKK